MEFIIGILGAGIGSGIMAIVLAMLQRRWANSDKSDVLAFLESNATKLS